MLHTIKHALKVLGTLGLAAVSGGIQKAISGSGKKARNGDKSRRTKQCELGPWMGMMMLGSLEASLISNCLKPDPRAMLALD